MSTCQVNDNSITDSNFSDNGMCPILSSSPNEESETCGSTSQDKESAPLVENPEEILGSVVHSNDSENGEKNSSVQLRTSARVSKKMRLDVIANQITTERKDLPKEEDKLDSKPKRRPFELWPQEDKNTFFDALNEYGKDFDAIQRYFEAKAKRKTLPEYTVKNKEQIRHFYYRTWHKISKHLRFPNEVKKATQELYGLINFGELRKKIGSVSEKTSLRLNELIYRGFTTIRIRGKNIRVKTPICRALRKLNQQEDMVEDLKLPTRVTVELRPRTNEAWARVQATAQNPRVQTILPLQRRLSTLLNVLEQRWLPQSLKHCEKLRSELNEVNANMESINEFTLSDTQVEPGSPNGSVPREVKVNAMSSAGLREIKKAKSRPQQILRVAPTLDATITPLSINLSEYFTSSRLSLNSHEERLGNHGAEELFNSMLQPGNKGCGRRGAKRQRIDSLSDKKKDHQAIQNHFDSSPEKSKDGFQIGFIPVDGEDDKPSCSFRLFGSGVCQDAGSRSVESGHDDGNINGDTVIISKNSNMIDEGDNIPDLGSDNGNVCQEIGSANQPTSMLYTLGSNDEIIKRVRAGWTVDNANALTIGELYLMFGANSKVKIEYWWEDLYDSSPTGVLSVGQEQALSQNSSIDDSLVSSNAMTSTLQKLLSIAKMFNSQSKCSCGHVCNGAARPSVSKAKVNRPVRGNAEAEKPSKPEIQLEIPNGAVTLNPPPISDGPFRRPLMPSPQFKPQPRPGTADAFKAQLEKFRPRGCNRKGRPAAVKKNVVVPRMLPLLPKAPQSSPVITFQVVPPNSPASGNFLPIAQSPSILNYTPASSPNSHHSSFSHKTPEEHPSQATFTASVTTLDSQSKSSRSEMDVSLPNLCEDQIVVNESKGEDGQPQSCHLVQDLFPPTLDTPVSSPPSISNLLDLSLQSELGLNNNPLVMETNFSGLLSSAAMQSSPPPASPSPSAILKEDENQWLGTEDFSLSSFLGHLESPLKSTSEPSQDHNQSTSISTDVETQMQCLMTETSLDYVAKFADLAAQMSSDGASKS